MYYRFLALLRWVLFGALNPLVERQVYAAGDVAGYRGYRILPLFGVIAFEEVDGSLRFYWSEGAWGAIRGLIYIVLIALLAALLFGTTMPTYAQDTEEAPVVASPTAEVGAEMPVEVTTVPIEDDAIVVDGPAVILDNRETIDNLISLAYTVIHALLFGGTILGVIGMVLRNRRARDEAEKLYMSTPPETQELILKVVNGYEEFSKELTAFLKGATDKLPNADENPGPLPPGMSRNVPTSERDVRPPGTQPY